MKDWWEWFRYVKGGYGGVWVVGVECDICLSVCLFYVVVFAYAV